MKVIAAKLYPTRSQEAEMNRFLRVCCWVYNRGLEQRQKAWKRRGESVSLYDQTAMLTQWRKRMGWIRSVPVEVTKVSLRRLDAAMRSFFRRVKSGESPGYPRFKSHRRCRSFEAIQPGKYLSADGRIHIPGIGLMRCRGLQPVDGKIKSIRVLKKARGWFVQLLIDNGRDPDPRPIARTVGLDLGLTSFATLSDGQKVDNPQWYRQSQRRLKFLQRRAARTQKGSKRRGKAYARVAVFHERIVDTRRDWMHKTARRLVTDFDLIAVEKLNVKGMVRSRLAKSISDASWGTFLTLLSLKAASAGVTVVSVNPRGTSQECSQCGRVVPKKLDDRVHRCECGCTTDRDENAARNILRRATAGLPVEGSSAGLSGISPAVGATQ